MSEKCTTAKNGVKIYSYTNSAQHGFYISLFLKGGVMYESDSECGITHFLEHVAIRNVNKLMDGELYSVLDKHGLEFNASTYSEMVQFYISGASSNFRCGAEIISMLLRPITLTKSDVDAERDRIKAEIREVDDKSTLSYFTSECVFLGTSLAKPITGTYKSVGRITRSSLERFRRESFTKDNFFLYVTGNASASDIAYLSSLIGEYELSAGGEEKQNIAPVPALFFTQRHRRAGEERGFYQGQIHL